MPRTLLIGWDAADWRFIDPLLARGLLPTLASLRERGVWGNLSTIRPALSPMLWTSMATGHRASRHGVLGFVEPMPDGTAVRPVPSTSRKCRALWNAAHLSGLTSNIVGWYATRPAERVRGCIVSNGFELPASASAEPWPVDPTAVHPPEMAGHLAALRVHPTEIDGAAILPFIPSAAKVDLARHPRIGKLRQLIAQTASIHAIATHLIEHTTWDLTAVYYEGIDRFGHEFMHFHPPQMNGVSDEEFATYQHVMVGCYRWFDMMLERLLGLAGTDTNVVLLSDHGYFHDRRRPEVEADPESWHRSHGVAVLAGPQIRQPEGGRLFGATILDVAPTVLSLLNLPVGRDMAGRAWAEVLRHSPPPPIDSWEDVPGDDGRIMPADNVAPADPAAAREAVRQLVELGYIDASATAGPEAAVNAASLMQYNLAISLLDEGRPGDAAAVLQPLSRAHPDDLALATQLAISHAANGDAAGARAVASAVCEQMKQTPARISLLLGVLDLSEGNTASAEAHLQHAQSTTGDHPDLFFRLGQVYLQSGRLPAAVQAFSRAIELDPDHAPSHDGLAETALARNDHAAAERHALDAVALAHHLPRAHFHLAAALAGQGKSLEALTAAGVCLHMAPSHRDARRLLADLLEEGGRVGEAAMHRGLIR